MRKGSSEIVSVTARQIFSRRGHPGVEATVVTANGAVGVAEVTAGLSVGKYEVQFAYDGGERWGGLGVQKAVDNVNSIIGPAVIGMDARHQREVDAAILKLDPTYEKSILGGNATASVSAATLKAGAACQGLPLYQHIGGVNACILPVPAAGIMNSSKRYGGSGKHTGDKPSYSIMCYGFDTFTEASYAAWQIQTALPKAMSNQFGLDPLLVRIPPAGLVDHEKAFWAVMAEVINSLGYEGKAGIQVDVAAGTYYNEDTGLYEGLFSAEPKSRDAVIEMYKWMVKEYPFVILEDPLDEDDFEGHAILTRELGVEIVGDDLFTTNPVRVQKGIEHGSAHAVLLKVNQIGTITEAFDMIQLAYRHGWGIMPCESRGEGADIADYAVGLSTGHIRESGTGPTANRLLQIEAELGPAAVFLGRQGLFPR